MDEWLSWDTVLKLACLIAAIGMVAEALILASRGKGSTDHE